MLIVVVSRLFTRFADLEVQGEVLRYHAVRYPFVGVAQPPAGVGWKDSIGLSRGLSVLIRSAQVNRSVNLFCVSRDRFMSMITN